MRKTILIILLLPALVWGQDVKIESGVTFGKLNQDVAGNTYFKDFAFGFYATAGLNYLKKRKFNIASNVGVLQKVGSGKVTFSDALGNNQYIIRQAFRIDYLSLNTFIECNLKENGIIPFAFGGPRLDYAINSNYVDFNERLAFGVTLGTGVKYAVSRLFFGFRAGYLINFNKILQTDDRTFSSSIMFGYKIK